MSVFLSPTHMAIALSNGIARKPKGDTLFHLRNDGITRGYVVGGFRGVPSLGLHNNSVKRIRLFEPRSTATGAILNWCEYNWNNIKDGDCVGWWVNESGITEIDVSEIFDDLDTALARAEKLNQVEIYDIHAKRCLPVKATATA